jgi:hypothetical protein
MISNETISKYPNLQQILLCSLTNYFVYVFRRSFSGISFLDEHSITVLRRKMSKEKQQKENLFHVYFCNVSELRRLKTSIEIFLCHCRKRFFNENILVEKIFAITMNKENARDIKEALNRTFVLYV